MRRQDVEQQIAHPDPVAGPRVLDGQFFLPDGPEQVGVRG
jgi:hypothetical protein